MRKKKQVLFFPQSLKWAVKYVMWKWTVLQSGLQGDAVVAAAFQWVGLNQNTLFL